MDSKPKEPRKTIEWTRDNQDILLIAGLWAEEMHKRTPAVRRLSLMYNRFLESFPDYSGSEENLSHHYNQFMRERILEGKAGTLEPIRQIIDAELTRLDLAKSENNDNMPDDLRAIVKYLKLGLEHGNKRLFNAVCFNCAKLCFGDPNKNHRSLMISEEEDMTIPIEGRYDNIPENIPYRDDTGRLRICKPCNAYRDIIKDINILNPVTKKMTLPPELADINDREMNEISLLTVYYNQHTRADLPTRKFPHFQGQVNLLNKNQEQYVNMLGIMCEKTESPKRKPAKIRFEKIKRALIWLRENNKLFKDFYSHCQTMYRYLEKDYKTIGTDEGYVAIDGKGLGDQLGDEDMGYFIPAENFDADYDLTEDDFRKGKLHPKDPKSNDELVPKAGILSPFLEAMAFPRDFPGGEGSYDPKNKNIKQRNYDIFLILNWEERFRRNPFLIFFMIDRYIKISLMNHHRIVIGVVGIKAVDTPKVKDFKNKDAYARYGTKVPANIPGSKSYWFIATQELLAMTSEFKRNPDFFITLTTNDNWPEIQCCVQYGPDHKCDQCPHAEDIGQSAVNHATECSIAFNQRFQLWKDKVLFNDKGEFGKVEHYFIRREYQKRGAVHMHMAIWCKEGTVPEDTVRAEMPRGGSDKTLEQTLRELVNKFQYHNCIDAHCLWSGQRRVPKCKYGFPAPLVNEPRPDDSKLRYLYKRRTEEDVRIVPYAMQTLLIMRAHVNVQKVSDEGFLLYLAKYMTKPEPVSKVRNPLAINRKFTDVERFLHMRVIGLVEANDILLQFPAKMKSVEVIYLPIEAEASIKVLKRKKHLDPNDPDSENVHYDNKMDKYLDRPAQLANITYPDFFRNYTYRVYAKKSEVADDYDSDSEENNDLPAEDSPIMEDQCMNGPKRKVRFRKNPAVVRYMFYCPYGQDLEKFCLKLLLENFPFDRQSFTNIFSTQNTSKSFMEECVIRGLWDAEKVCLAFLHNAEKMNQLKIKEIAGQLKEFGFLVHPEIRELLQTLEEKEALARFPNYEMEYKGEGEVGEEERFPVQELNLDPLQTYINSFNPEQRRIYDHISDSIINEKQILAAIVGPAGTGKSHLLRGLCALCLQSPYLDWKEKGYRSLAVLAPTGVAAYLIKGRTIHSWFKFDTTLKCHVRKNTMDDAFIRYCDVWFIDEMSMVENIVFDAVEYHMRLITREGQSLKIFGGKSVILFGDPAQLPSRRNPIFAGKLFPHFSIFNLKRIERQQDPKFATISE